VGQNGGGNGNPEAAQQPNQPQGTEYTLQGIRSTSGIGWSGKMLMGMLNRCNALPSNRGAPS